jgi:heat shock protein HslJ/uncharacterized lipoprotein NlpE involved in copper resistance
MKENPAFNYPVHFLGLVKEKNFNQKYQLDLFSNNSYFLRKIYFKNDILTKTDDTIGRWYLDSKNRLVLTNTNNSSNFFYLVDQKTIEIMSSTGKQIDSKTNHKLLASNSAKTIEPSLFMYGIYSYIADSSVFKECSTGMKFRVSLNKDSLSLQKAYLKNKTLAGDAIKVYLKGKLTLKDGMDRKTNVPTIEVEKFINIIPKERCQNPYTKANLTNTYWKLTILNNKSIKQTNNTKREAHIILSQGKLRGNSGCNGIGGSYILDKDKLSFSDKGVMMTRMFCKQSREEEFLEAMRNMYKYKIEGEYLNIFDKNGVNLARFESVYLY